MPRILVLRHEIFEHLGYFADIFTSRNVPLSYHDLAGPFLAAPYDGLVVMGGPMSANDPLPGLTAEISLIQKSLSAGKPILGICLGAQLTARALGARVYRNRELEIGWAPVHWTAAGRSDPLFCGLKSPETFFHWHGETFDLPRGAEWLAYSEKTRHQAYRFGSNVYGLQFHPEVTAEMIGEWSAEPVNCGDVATLGAPIDAHAFEQRDLARQIAERWLALF